MCTKISYDKLIVVSDTDIHYIPKMGIIIDKSTNRWIYNLRIPEQRPFLYYSLVFEKYKYTKQYITLTHKYGKKLSHRIYKIYLHLDDRILSKSIIIEKYLSDKIHRCLILLEMNRLKKQKKYNHTVNKFRSKLLDSKNSIILPWDVIELTQDTYYNISKKEFIHYNNIDIFSIKKNGGIIETNNISSVLNFYNQ